jgi:transposase
MSRLPRTTTLCRRLTAAFDRDQAVCRLRRHHADRGHWSWVAYEGSDAEVSFTADEPVLTSAGTVEMGEDGKPRTQAVRRTMPVRTVVCYSSELYHQKAETLGAIAKRESARSVKLIATIERRSYACAEDAQEEADRLHADQPYITKTLHCTIVRVELVARRARRGRPAKGDPAPAVTIRYGLQVAAKDAEPKEVAQRLRVAATYVIVRHRVAGWEISDEEMIDDYARQWRCEHGFAWLKSQAAINPMFVQTPRRVAALCFIYCIALMIHTLIQRNIRRYLHEHGLGLPYRRNKPSPNITARFFYEIFRGVTSQVVSFGGQSERRIFGEDQWTALGLKAVGASRNAYHPVFAKNGPGK